MGHFLVVRFIMKEKGHGIRYLCVPGSLAFRSALSSLSSFFSFFSFFFTGDSLFENWERSFVQIALLFVLKILDPPRFVWRQAWDATWQVCLPWIWDRGLLEVDIAFFGLFFNYALINHSFWVLFSLSQSFQCFTYLKLRFFGDSIQFLLVFLVYIKNEEFLELSATKQLSF